MIGENIEHYRVTAKLGQGGMGEVYRATDTQLDRTVAIKILPEEFCESAERLKRFEQEAKTLASLSHPNILVVHGCGVHAGSPYLVSEFIEGRTLREELADGALAPRRVLDLALQTARGLAAAHGAGVIHRDLKPENLMVTPQGLVKILDFGLAKLREPAPRSPARDRRSVVDVEAPTVKALELTKPGQVMGTPSYMSPEQVEAKAVDHRTDIFSFGCVLYELIAGKRCFGRGSPVETMMAVLKEDPEDLTSTNPGLSPAIDRIVRRCLEKRPHDRFQSAQDLAFTLENSSASSSASNLGALARPPLALRWRYSLWLAWAVTILAVGAAIAAIMSAQRKSISLPTAPTASTPRVIDLRLPRPDAVDSFDEEITDMAIAPDGRKFVYVNTEGLWLRWIDRVSPVVLLAEGEGFRAPFWSPQSNVVAYLTGAGLFRVAVAGGEPELVCRTGRPWPIGAGGSWLADDRMVFSLGLSDIYQASARGGEATPVLLREENEVGLEFAHPLPDGRGILFVAFTEAGADSIHVWTPDGGRKLLLKIPGIRLTKPVYSPSGHVIYGRSRESSGVWAFPFSMAQLGRVGEPVLVSDRGADPSVADDGALLLNLTREGIRQLVWVDRTGQIDGVIGQPRRGLSGPRLSHSGQRIAVSIRDRNWEIWTVDVGRGVFTPAIKTHELNISPFWFPDGDKLAFRRWARGMPLVLIKKLDGQGSEEEIIPGFLNHLSPSGKYLLVLPAPDTDSAPGYIQLGDPNPVLVEFPSEFEESKPWNLRLSPDDQLLAFRSSETGQTEVFLVDFPSCSQKRVVSRGTGDSLEWHPDGSALYYSSADGRSLTSVAVTRKGNKVALGEPVKVELPDNISGLGFDISADGERFLMLRNVPEPLEADGLPLPQALLIENWNDGVRQKP